MVEQPRGYFLEVFPFFQHRKEEERQADNEASSIFRMFSQLGLRNARPATGIQNPKPRKVPRKKPDKFLSRARPQTPKKNSKNTEKRNLKMHFLSVFRRFFSFFVFLSFFHHCLFFRGISGLGALNPCSRSGVSEC